jgi:hypothetical protein
MNLDIMSGPPVLPENIINVKKTYDEVRCANRDCRRWMMVRQEDVPHGKHQPWF